MTLIDKTELLQNIQKHAGASDDDPYSFIEDVLYMINNAKEVDDVPVVHGQWLPYEFCTNGTWHKCSICNVAYQYKDCPKPISTIRHNYCPNCGARMDGKENVCSD